jgi:hypothetical protein
LVAQDEDLQILGGVVIGEQGEELDGSVTKPTRVDRTGRRPTTSEFLHPTVDHGLRGPAACRVES